MMSQRDSGYERKERDLYETPEWVTLALVSHLPPIKGVIWEPAAGSGKMVRALMSKGFDVCGTDIDSEYSQADFLEAQKPDAAAIITNPPYALAVQFINRALALTHTTDGVVAMLLRTDFDHAKTREWAFGRHRAFARKVVLTKRIQWFEDSKGSPSFNHAWFIWDWQNKGAPTLAYGP